jgi:hypothetical protein
VRGDGFQIGSFDREDDHGEEGKGEEADRGEEEGRSGTQEEKGGKGDSEEVGEVGEEDSEEGDEESSAEAQSACPHGSPGAGRISSDLASVRRFEFGRRRQQLVRAASVPGVRPCGPAAPRLSE